MSNADILPIARQSVLHPVPGAFGQAEELLEKLQAYYAILPGYVLGFCYRPSDDPGELGRITVWRDIENADHAAQDDHVVALRSQLKSLVRDDSIERVLTIKGMPYIATGV